MNRKQDATAQWDRRLLTQLHKLTRPQQAAIMQAIDLLAARNFRAPPPTLAVIIPIRKR